MKQCIQINNTAYIGRTWSNVFKPIIQLTLVEH